MADNDLQILFINNAILIHIRNEHAATAAIYDISGFTVLLAQCAAHKPDIGTVNVSIHIHIAGQWTCLWLSGEEDHSAPNGCYAANQQQGYEHGLLYHAFNTNKLAQISKSPILGLQPHFAYL